jgi:L-lysine 6-transaminase
MLDHLVDVGVLDSTWGGPLVDMVRATREIGIMKRERLIEETARLGKVLTAGLLDVEKRYPDCLINVRGLGFVQGFTVLPAHTGAARDLLLKIALRQYLLLMLDAGKSSVRLRPNLSTSRADVERFLSVLEQCLKRLRRERPREWARESLRQRSGSVENFTRLAQ